VIPSSLLTHNCTIQRRSTGSTNAVGQPVYTWANLATGVSCMYEPMRSGVDVGEQLGKFELLVTQPKLYLLSSQSISIDDRISNVVRTSDSAVIEAGPLSVTQITDPGGEGDHLEVSLEKVA